MGKYQGRHTIEKAECTALCWENTNVLVIGIHTNVDLKSDNNMITCILNGKSNNLGAVTITLERIFHLGHPIQIF